MLPFTVDQFLHVFEQYNLAIWPLHIVAYLLALTALFLTFKKIRYADQIISLVLALFWGWIGIVYQIMYFSTINRIAVVFGILFIVQAIVWLVFGVLRLKLSFRAELNPYTLIGGILIVYAMLIYPLIGTLLGHGYPSSPSFGVAPCPTTIFTFGLLLCTNARVPKSVLIIPFVWSLIGFAAALLLGIREDIGLILASVLCVACLSWRDRMTIAHGKRQRYA